MRLIDADYLIDALSGFNDTEHGDKQFLFGIASAKEIVEYAETIDAELVRHGKWYFSTQGMDTVLVPNSMTYVPTRAVRRCSLCHSAMETSGVQKEPARYCPNCGAKMDEVSE